MKKILCIGPAMVKYTSFVNSLPKGNEEYSSDESVMSIAGSGYEFAQVLKDFGFPCSVLSPVGTGVYGDEVREAAKQEGIDLPLRSAEIAGASYEMVDPSGHKRMFVVPGAEHSFSVNDVQELDPDDVSFVVVFGEMLSEENSEDLLSFLDDVNKKIYFVPMGYAENFDAVTIKRLLALEPVWILEEEDLHDLCPVSEDLKEAALSWYGQAQSPVIVLQKGLGAFCCDETGSYIAPGKNSMPLLAWTAGLACALFAGVDWQNSLMYANAFSQIDRRDSGAVKNMRQRLAGIILRR